MPRGEDEGAQTSALDCELLYSPLGKSAEVLSQSKKHKY